MLLVVTADMVAATAQIRDDDRAGVAESPASTPPPPRGTSSARTDVAAVESNGTAASDDVTSSTGTDHRRVTSVAVELATFSTNDDKAALTSV